jgi:hypothetical protein
MMMDTIRAAWLAEIGFLKGRSTTHCRHPIATRPGSRPPLWEMATAAEQAENDHQWGQAAQSEPEVEFDQSVSWRRVIFARHGRLFRIRGWQCGIDDATREVPGPRG